MDDSPEEPEGTEPGPWEGAGGPDDAEAGLRGWIDPDDRLWRHPSELAAARVASPVLLNAPPRHPYRNGVMILVGVGALAAAVAWVVVLFSPGSRHPVQSTSAVTAADAPLTTLAGTLNTVPAAAQAAGHSIVELQATTSHGTVSLIGVAVAEGGLVATTADLLGDATHIFLMGPGDTRQPASLVGMDRASDVALIEVPEDLPVAPVADDASPSGGSADMTLSFVPAGGSALAVHCTPGSITGVGAAIGVGPAGGMPSITSSPAPTAITAGEPLLDADGSLLGILYDPQPTSSVATFLPSGLVVGVADDLRSNSKVLSGWLGISGTDAPAHAGAEIEAVDPNGPAANHLAPGQVIVAVDAVPVHTMAELRARVYVLSPGAKVALSVQQAAGVKVVDVTLGRSS